MTKAMHRIQRKNKFLPYLLTLPSMLLFSMFTFYPFLKTIALSFFLTDKRGNPTKWAGISNWVRVLSKETFWKIIAITLEIAGINLVFTFGLAIFFALLSSQKKKGGKLYQTMYALPMAIASSPAAAIFLFIFRQKNGVVNSLLGGANIGWTTEMRQYFLALPKEYKEAATIDGCGEIGYLFRVAMPLAVPTFASLAIYLFVQIYNQFFWPLLVTHENAMRTIQIGIAFLVTGDVISFGQILAGAMIAILPSVLVYILGQDYIIQGMTAGGIKG